MANSKVPKLLIVDDIPANIYALEDLLNDLDIEIYTALGGYRALELTLEHDFSVILLDVQMPEINGYQVAEAIHKNEATKNTPIVFVTANYCNQANVLTGYDSGAVDYITKPVNAKVLRSKVIIFTDLYRAQKSTEAVLRSAKVLADEANFAKSAFLANMSHELRTPLTAVIGYAEKIAHSDVSEEEKLKAAETIVRNGTHLLSIINDILDLSKIESGQMDVELLPQSVCGLINGIVDLLKPKAHEKGLKLDVVYETSIPKTIETDQIRLRQIIINLLNNAIKFTNEGKVEIRVSLVADKERIRFEIVDTGIGISEELQQRLFKAFSQADISITREFGGTGLGLVISKQLAQRLGGDISVQSEEGKGSAFALEVATGSLAKVDIISTPSNKLESEKQESLVQQPAPQPEKLCGDILLAEDCEDNRNLISFYLKRAGASVEIVKNGQEAIDKASSKDFDLILMDMQMPIMGGHRATQLLRQKGCEIPIIALTAEAMKHHIERCMDVGCSDHIAKPFKHKNLIQVISKHLNGAETPERA